MRSPPLCAVVADYEGEFLTFPLTPTSRQLKLNFRTPQAGEVKVGIIGVDGRSVADLMEAWGVEPIEVALEIERRKVGLRAVEKIGEALG